MEEIRQLFGGTGEVAIDVETIVACASACDGASIDDSVEDLSQSLETLSAKYAGLAEAEKLCMARKVLEAVHRSEEGSARAKNENETSTSGDGASCRPGLQTLQELCPGIPAAYLDHVLCRELGDVEAAAIWLTGREGLRREADRWVAAQQAAAERQEEEARAERASRKALLSRFAFQPVAKAEAARPHLKKGGWRAAEPGTAEPASKVRYRDGMPVASKGERFIVQSVKPEWDGGSQGKVYTKGKRGKGVTG